MREPVTLKKYWEMLAGHDWLYNYSDDHSVWSRGHRAQKELERISAQSDVHRRLLNHFMEWRFSGGDEPVMPEEEGDHGQD